MLNHGLLTHSQGFKLAIGPFQLSLLLQLLLKLLLLALLAEVKNPMLDNLILCFFQRVDRILLNDI